MKHAGSIVFAFGFGTALAFGWAAFPRLLYTTQQQPLEFSHRVHTGEKGGMSCEDCHSITDAGYFTGVPKLEKCSVCHAEPLSKDPHELRLVERYVKPEREIPWLIYSRQPQNVRFSHAIHVRRGKVACESCHGQHGKTDTLRPYQQNRISGYSRDIWGASISRISFEAQERPAMKMDDCTRCHHTNHVVTGCRACHK